jgi:hypothetical protein
MKMMIQLMAMTLPNPSEEPDDMNADLVHEGDAAAPTTPSRKKSPKGKGWVLCKKKDDGARHGYHETKYCN